MKTYKSIMAVLCLALLTTAGCQSELLIDDQQHRQAVADTIDFVGGFIDKPVNTKSTALLAEHLNTMGVWGWQIIPEGDELKLFDNQIVSYSNATGDWTYSPKKLWSDDSQYRFYAYAPHSDSTAGSTVSIDPVTGRFKIDDITLGGSNIMYNTPLRAASGNFNGVTDIDWMIDRTGLTGVKSSFGRKVTFNMQHILVKFNVKVRINNILEADPSIVSVTLDSLTIGTFIGHGSFEQKLNHTPDPGNADDNAVQEWTIDPSKPRYSINSARNVGIDATGFYVIESLLIPQEVDPGNTVKISYTTTSHDAHTERYIGIFNLNSVFDRFVGGNNYTLVITISPDVITFDAGSGSWETAFTNGVF